MLDKKIELLPFAPYSTKAIEDWINEEARRGWQVVGAVPFVPILIKFSRGDGGPYHILMDDPDEKDSVCLLPGCGFVVRGKLNEFDVSGFDQNTSLVKLSLRGLIFALAEIIACMLFLCYVDSAENFNWLSTRGVIGLIYICSTGYGMVYSLYTMFAGVIRFPDRRRSIWPTVAYYVIFCTSIITLITLLPFIFSEDAINGIRAVLQNR